MSMASLTPPRPGVFGGVGAKHCTKPPAQRHRVSVALASAPRSFDGRLGGVSRAKGAAKAALMPRDVSLGVRGRRRCVVVRAHGEHGHGHSHGSRRPSFSGNDANADACKKACCGAYAADVPDAVDGSFDEEAFLSDAGLGSGDENTMASAQFMSTGSGNAVERALTAVYRFTGVGWLADKLRGNAMLCAVSWVFLVIGGVAHVCRHYGIDTASAAAVETAAVAAVYAMVGTSEFVDVSYELAVGNLNIHVLTSLAVIGTVVLGCAVEGAMLLVLFASAHFVEGRLTGHARGDLRSLWATVPGEATVVDLNPDGSPDTGSERVVAARNVSVGTYVFVKAGQQVPLDGVVVHGSALVSIQHITGEALPVTKRVGDEIPAGAVNADGALVVRTLRSSEDSTPARIARLTEAAQNRRPSVSRMLDTFGDRYSKAILGVTALTMVVGPLALGWPLMGRTGAMYRAFAFLSAAAPCALLMSPLVYIAAVGACARRGVLVRGGATFDALAECGTVALDKTGTITTGRMSCSAISVASSLVAAVKESALTGAAPGGESGAGVTAREGVTATAGVTEVGATMPVTQTSSNPAHHATALAIAASLERGATHPIARAVMDTAASVGLQSTLPDITVSDFKVVAGCGVEGLVRQGKNGMAGTPRLARFGSVEWATEIAGSPERVDSLRASVGYNSSDGAVKAMLVVQDAPAKNGDAGVKNGDGEWSDIDRLSCVFSFRDSLHSKAAAAVADLSKGGWRDAGMKLVMLTGDNPESAADIAGTVGLRSDAVYAGLAPGDKLRIVEQARKEAEAEDLKYKRVAMVGDGINDAPALAAADVGVAVATTPSEAAAAAADVLLLHADTDGISQLPELFDLAARTRAVLRQNITLAVVSILGSALPALVGAFPLWLAVLLHEGSTLLVAVNSVRLLGTFGRQPLRKSTVFATLGLFAMCCVGGAWLSPAVRASLGGWGATVLATPAFVAASLAAKSAWAGLLAGCLHTLTGPDHLAALAPLAVSASRAQNAMMGALWGCGHNTGQMLFGLLFVLLKDKLPFNMEVIGQWGQGIVGVTLIVIGAMGFWEAREMAAGRGHSHSHSHSHGLPFGIGKGMFGDHAHSHSHSHDEGDLTANLRYAHAHAEGSKPDEHGHSHSHEHEHGHSHAHDHGHSHGGAEEAVGELSAEEEDMARKKKEGSFLSWTYITGTIHGLQPDALLLLLPAFALPRLQAIAFLTTFFFGTILAMGTYTAFLGAGTAALQKSNPKAVSVVSRISSSVAVAIGLGLILSAVFGFEIF